MGEGQGHFSDEEGDNKAANVAFSYLTSSTINASGLLDDGLIEHSRAEM